MDLVTLKLIWKLWIVNEKCQKFKMFRLTIDIDRNLKLFKHIWLRDMIVFLSMKMDRRNGLKNQLECHLFSEPRIQFMIQWIYKIL